MFRYPKPRTVQLGVALLTMFAFVLQASAVTVTITDPSPTFTARKDGCCPEECPTCVVTADYPTESDVFADIMFLEAWDNWNNEPDNPKGWGLIDGGVLNGFFDITTYDAGFKDCCGGVKIRISYTAGDWDPDPDDVVWSQAIYTNKKKAGAAGPGNPYLDIVFPQKKAEKPVPGCRNPPNKEGEEDCWSWLPPVYPHQYEDSHFYDFPCRCCPSVCEEATFWEGNAYLTAADYDIQQLTVYEGVVWGFGIECVPEPATMMLLALGGLALLRRRRTC